MCDHRFITTHWSPSPGISTVSMAMLMHLIFSLARVCFFLPAPLYVLVIMDSLLAWQFFEDKICILTPHSEASFIHKTTHPLTVA